MDLVSEINVYIYCGCDNFSFFFKQTQNWFDNTTIIMIIKHNELYSLNN